MRLYFLEELMASALDFKDWLIKHISMSADAGNSHLGIWTFHGLSLQLSTQVTGASSG